MEDKKKEKEKEKKKQKKRHGNGEKMGERKICRGLQFDTRYTSSARLHVVKLAFPDAVIELCSPKFTC